MSIDLSGRAAIVTGGSSGVGRATALALAREGVNVAVVGRRLDKCEEAAQEIRESGGQALPISCDVKNPLDVTMAVQHTLQTFGGVDILINNAGHGSRTRILDMTDEAFDDMIRTHVHGTFYFCRECYKAMLSAGRGHIVNVASVAGYWPGKGEISYGTAKAAQVKFSQHMYTELQEHANKTRAPGTEGFFLHTLMPGGINTPFWEPLNIPVQQAGRLESEHMADLIVTILKNPDKMRDFFKDYYKNGPVDIYHFEGFEKFPYVMSVGLKQKKTV